MFETMVESTGRRGGGKTGRYFALTTILYCLGLGGLAVATVVGFSPVLAEEYQLESMLAPPPVPAGPPPSIRIQRTVLQPSRAAVFASPVRPAVDVLPASQVPDTGPIHFGPVTPGAPYDPTIPAGGGVYGGRPSASEPPPPPTPKPDPSPAPTQQQAPMQISKGVLQGKALVKIRPEYSAIARQIKAQGPVQVLVLISEEGRVIEATAVEGHPVLRPLAVKAAREWVFQPTRLSDIPVKVQGILTFNFVIQ